MTPADTLPRVARQERAAENLAALLMMLLVRGIQDLNLLRAVETVPPEFFVPHRFADLARRPIARAGCKLYCRAKLPLSEGTDCPR
jgi:protein-L-isoaspartate(D-aspartate) O-methyltransferase